MRYSNPEGHGVELYLPLFSQCLLCCAKYSFGICPTPFLSALLQTIFPVHINDLKIILPAIPDVLPVLCHQMPFSVPIRLFLLLLLFTLRGCLCSQYLFRIFPINSSIKCNIKMGSFIASQTEHCVLRNSIVLLNFVQFG